TRTSVGMPKRSAIRSSVSPACTLYSQPESRGIVSTWPGWSKLGSEMPELRMIVSPLTPNCVATLLSVSPGRTMYVAYVVYPATIGPSGPGSAGSATGVARRAPDGGNAAVACWACARIWVAVTVRAGVAAAVAGADVGRAVSVEVGRVVAVGATKLVAVGCS